MLAACEANDQTLMAENFPLVPSLIPLTKEQCHQDCPLWPYLNIDEIDHLHTRITIVRASVQIDLEAKLLSSPFVEMLRNPGVQ